MAEFTRLPAATKEYSQFAWQKIILIQAQPTPQPQTQPNIIDIKTVGTLVTIMSTIVALIWWYLKKRRTSKFPVDTTPFQVLPPPNSDILSVVFPGDGENPLADAAIKYQQSLIQIMS